MGITVRFWGPLLCDFGQVMISLGLGFLVFKMKGDKLEMFSLWFDLVLRYVHVFSLRGQN